MTTTDQYDHVFAPELTPLDQLFRYLYENADQRAEFANLSLPEGWDRVDAIAGIEQLVSSGKIRSAGEVHQILNVRCGGPTDPFCYGCVTCKGSPCINNHSPDRAEVREDGSRVCTACRDQYQRTTRIQGHRVAPSREVIESGTTRRQRRRAQRRH